MANANSPFGFKAVSLHGTDPQQNVFAPDGYSIASGYGTDIFFGDPVKSSGTADADGRPGIVIGTNGPIRGAFAGCFYTDSTGAPQYSMRWPASTVAADAKAMVYDHPETVFMIQASASVAATDVGNKADFVSGSGNTRTNVSGYQLDASTIGSQDCLLILGKGQMDSPNDFGSAYVKLLVLIREHELGPTLTAV